MFDIARYDKFVSSVFRILYFINSLISRECAGWSGGSITKGISEFRWSGGSITKGISEFHFAGEKFPEIIEDKGYLSLYISRHAVKGITSIQLHYNYGQTNHHHHQI